MPRKLPFFLISLVLVLGISGFNPARSAAQNLNPPAPPGAPQQDSKGRWYRRPAQPASSAFLTSTPAAGGPDDFGYTWNDSVPYSWIEANSGTDTGMSGYSCGQAVGPINLPFPMKFYENTYSQVWINAGGYLAFTEEDADECGPDGARFPDPGSKTNMIAPLWSRLNLGNSGSTSRVFYQSGGAAPSRYFVVQWNQVEYSYPPFDGTTTFTHEAILYENGDIRFQYQTIDTGGGYYCDDIAIGIENSNGYDGLTYLDWCDAPLSNKAVLFSRPPDSARIQVLNPYQGTFTQSHETLNDTLRIVNSGTLGSDTYNLTTTSAWPLTFYAVSGAPLSDTNGDGTVDTGPLSQGGAYTLSIQVQTPTIVNPTDLNEFAVKFTSVKDPNRSKSAMLQATVPVPFAQSYTNEDGMGLFLVKPGASQEVLLPESWGYDMAVAEIPSQGFAYLWENGYWLDEDYTLYVNEIAYAVLDQAGNPTSTVRKLVDLSGATVNTYDNEPTLAVAPNGSIGILWYRWQIDQDDRRNSNIYFAVLSPAGEVSYGPVNLTNNNAWGAWNALNVKNYYSPSIAATSDNRFILTWNEYYEPSENDSVSNIAYTVRGSNGASIKDPSLLTDAVTGANRYYFDPAVEGISNGQALLAFRKSDWSGSDVYFVILDSSGSTVKTMTNLSSDGNTGEETGRPDIARFSNGNIAVAWSTYEPDGTRYAVLDTSFNRIAGPVSLTHPAMRPTSNYSITHLSLAADTAGHVALTWGDVDYNTSRSLYYALLASDGSVQTPPMIFLSSESRINTGAQGYSSASFTFSPTTAGVDTAIQAPGANYASPGGTVQIPIQFGNSGSTKATSVLVTAALADGLSYVSDTSGVTPTSGSTQTPAAADGAQYSWRFPADLSFLGRGQFNLTLGIGDVPLGTSYPVTITIASAEEDAIGKNNSYTFNIKAAKQLYIPLVPKQ